jgi:hypothetical protein
VGGLITVCVNDRDGGARTSISSGDSTSAYGRMPSTRQRAPDRTSGELRAPPGPSRGYRIWAVVQLVDGVLNAAAHVMADVPVIVDDVGDLFTDT